MSNQPSNDIIRLNQQEKMITVARDLHSDGDRQYGHPEYTRGMAELIAQTTVLAHEDADNVRDDAFVSILASPKR